MRIIHPNGDGGVAITIPSAEWTGTIQALAERIVPTGVPYRIVNDEDIPSDRSQRDLWTADFSNPDGYGQ